MKLKISVLMSSMAAVCAVTGAFAQASDPAGVWIDHTGRGAVQIASCDSGYCGRIFWLKETDNAKVCGLQVIGDVKPAAGGKYDGGWIYDPDEQAKYSVELTLLPNGKLKVLGYLGTKMLGETMIWTRAPAGIKHCST